MNIYYAGLNNSKLFSDDDGNPEPVVDTFTKIAFPDLVDLEIGWNYIILWKSDKNLYLSGKMNINWYEDSGGTSISLEPPDKVTAFKQALPGKETVTALSADNEIWQYKIFERTWRKVRNFIKSDNDDNGDREYPVRIFRGGCTVALTNLGRIYNIPTLVEMETEVKFVDVACGFDHTVMLDDNGNVYSMGMGTRGQLGHGDLEDCDNPKIIEALAGLRVIQISASGWHSAAITDQGDLYTWGWNTNGELGIPDEDKKIFATPQAIDFRDEDNRNFNPTVEKVRCGNIFTICMLDDGSLWGSGSNKYGQLGISKNTLQSSKIFLRLTHGVDEKSIRDFKCQEWGSILITD